MVVVVVAVVWAEVEGLRLGGSGRVLELVLGADGRRLVWSARSGCDKEIFALRSASASL